MMSDNPGLTEEPIIYNNFIIVKAISQLLKFCLWIKYEECSSWFVNDVVLSIHVIISGYNFKCCEEI